MQQQQQQLDGKSLYKYHNRNVHTERMHQYLCIRSDRKTGSVFDIWLKLRQNVLFVMIIVYKNKNKNVTPFHVRNLVITISPLKQCTMILNTLYLGVTIFALMLIAKRDDASNMLTSWQTHTHARTPETYEKCARVRISDGMPLKSFVCWATLSGKRGDCVLCAMFNISASRIRLQCIVPRL